MNRIKRRFVSEFEISKSKFISLLCPLNNKDEVKDILKDIQKEYPKATHYCYGYVFDGLTKSNDDGEPSKTAGRPILEVMLHQELNRALLVVVRYFGGIKLGAGGLTRAYVQGATSVINVAEIYKEEVRKLYKLTIDYNFIDVLNIYLKDHNIDILNEEYEEKVVYTISCIEVDKQDLLNFLKGQVDIEFINEELVLTRK